MDGGPRPSVVVGPRCWAGPSSGLACAAIPGCRRCRARLTALGPAYIKFGQSCRRAPDVVGDRLAGELQVLQDKLPPFPTDVARRVVEHEMEKPPRRAVHRVLGRGGGGLHRASAQGQAGRDRTRGSPFKILRPGIERAFRKDIDAFYLIAWVIETGLAGLPEGCGRGAVIEHFEGVVMQGARPQDRILRRRRVRRQYGGRSGASWCRRSNGSCPSRRMMNAGLGRRGASRVVGSGRDRRGGSLIARRWPRACCRRSCAMRYATGSFHADMHQGNLKVAPNGDVVALDFGIMGRIDEYTRRVYAENPSTASFARITGAWPRFNLRGRVTCRRTGGRGRVSRRRCVRWASPSSVMDASRISMARLLSYLFEVT